MWLVGLIVLCGSALLALTLAGLLALLHTAYWYAAPPLSPQAQAFEASAQNLPSSPDNAYRVEGLFAPAALDSLAYGKCAHPLLQLAKDDETQRQAGLARCAQGQPTLTLPPALEQAKVSPAWTEREWLALAQAVPDDTLLARSKAIAAAGPRSFGYRYLDPLPPVRPLGALNLWHSAHALALWRQGRTADAVSAFEGAVAENLQSADDTILEAMFSVRGLSENLLALQRALAQSPPTDEAITQRLRQVLDAVDSMPAQGVKAMDAEWRSYSSAVDFEELFKQSDRRGALGWVKTVRNHLAFREDTLNRLAIQFGDARQRVLAGAQGAWTDQKPPAPADTNPCPVLGNAGYLCYAVMPNPTGRYVLASTGDIAIGYTRYGIRIADVRNLAAATRLTLEARRQRLSGDALTAFVSSAPPNMRDVFTRQPFAYHPVTHKLGVILRNKSSVLGEPGVYELVL
ncbi:hypothetical protein [Hydrogenophaga sp. MI9]|uniref:hypothetical protein n=1 Tax=Hydrogenophaga sp. MI9 TaxID=3453719 RepID=UPI003EE89AE3